jgi:Outer membrane protein beta-barrel domain
MLFKKEGKVKKSKVLFALLVLVAMALNASAFEPVELDEKWNLGVNAQAVIPKDDAFDNGFNVQGLLSYDVMDFIAIGLDVGWTTYDINDGGIDFGSVNSILILGDIILKYPMEVGDDFVLVPFLINGFGGVITNVDESSTVTSVGGSFEVENSFAYKLGGGFDFYFNEMIAVTFETSYLFNNADWTAKVNSASADADINCNAYYVGGGLKVKF